MLSLDFNGMWLNKQNKIENTLWMSDVGITDSVNAINTHLLKCLRVTNPRNQNKNTNFKIESSVSLLSNNVRLELHEMN